MDHVAEVNADPKAAHVLRVSHRPEQLACLPQQLPHELPLSQHLTREPPMPIAAVA